MQHGHIRPPILSTPVDVNSTNLGQSTNLEEKNCCNTEDIHGNVPDFIIHNNWS